MLSRACSAAVNGIDAYAIGFEVNCGYGETFIAIFSYYIHISINNDIGTYWR
jgi:hypothetical protein